MVDPYGYPHKLRRKLMVAALVDGEPCELCPRPMYKWQKLHLDHVTPVWRGGGGRYRLVHAKCNMSRGGRDGARITNARRRQRKSRW